MRQPQIEENCTTQLTCNFHTCQGQEKTQELVLTENKNKNKKLKKHNYSDHRGMTYRFPFKKKLADVL